MTQHTFYLQIRGEDYDVATDISKLPTPKPNKRWFLYGVTIEQGQITRVFCTSWIAHNPQVWTQEEHIRQGVKLHTITVVMGADWTTIRGRNLAIDALRYLIAESV